MPHIGVIDTGVLIGFTIEQDQHHENCRDYIIDGGHSDVFLPPTANAEFTMIEREIRESISDEVIQHRQSVQNEVNDDRLDRSGLRFIRDDLLDPNELKRVYSFLYKFYTNLIQTRVEIYIQEIVSKLSNIETEVWIDRSEDYGGWQSHVSVWIRDIETYPSVQSDLLIHEGDDPQICIEAHHISLQYPENLSKLATTNRRHFYDKKPGELESRKDNIERVTDIDEVIDLSAPLRQSP